jgi:hypothetical protein
MVPGVDSVTHSSRSALERDVAQSLVPFWVMRTNSPRVSAVQLIFRALLSES